MVKEMNIVLFDANDGAIRISLENGGFAQVDAAGILFAENDVTDALIDLGVKPTDQFFNAESVEFCEEQGFEFNEAGDIIAKAVSDLKNTLRARLVG